MTEPLHERYTRTPAARLRPGDQGIGIIDLGDGEPFPIQVTVQTLDPTGAIVIDPYGNQFKTTALYAVGENLTQIIETEHRQEETTAQQQRTATYQRNKP